MSRYAQAVERLLPRIDLGSPGIGILVVPPGQHSLIAQALSAHLPGAVSMPLQAESLHSGPPRLIITGLPSDRQQAESALSALRDRRGWIASTGRLILLLLTRHELAEVQRAAADVASARLFLEPVPLIPEPLVDEEGAREALAQWYRTWLGRLDLRGLIRAEHEDVSWHIEDIYQDIHATLTSLQRRDGRVLWSTDERPLGRVLLGTDDQPLFEQLDWIRRIGPLFNHLVTVLGAPGSGKTFFLRWLAIRAAGAHRLWDIDRPVPLLASLSAYAQSPGPVSLREYLTETLLGADQSAAHLVEGAISEHRAIFLLDGLDEAGDESTRGRMAAAVERLAEEAEGNLIIVTSRIAGYKSTARSAVHFTLTPLNDSAISGFLIRWCELYARDQAGDTAAARQRGQELGRKLAHEVLEHPQIHELARSPLLLTVLAIIQRAGGRLPDHRVELYEHATRILVERWNRVRSLSHSTDAPPIKTADAVRLLGPVALELIRTGSRGAVSEDVLRALLQRSLAEAPQRGMTHPDTALELFRNSLGLLVEQRPGMYAFLHLTLAEYLAARELVRTQALEHLAENPHQVFRPEWREVLLLAAGELGVNRADDARLESFVDTLLQSAALRDSSPSASIPSLLGGLLADDTGLSLTPASRLLDALIPHLWFEQAYGFETSLLDVLEEALPLTKRIKNGRFSTELLSRLTHHCAHGVSPRILANLLDSGPGDVDDLVQLLDAAGIDSGPFIIQCFQQSEGRDDTFITIPCHGHRENGDIVLTLTVSAWLDAQVRSQGLPWGFRALLFPSAQSSTFHEVLVPWKDTHRIGTANPERVILESRSAAPPVKPSDSAVIVLCHVAWPQKSG